jgi:hypothetical protein
MTINQKGNAKRHPNKSVRVSTHTPVLELAISLLGNNITIVEHGMGISSTPFFHKEVKISRILSFEDDKKWMNCADCNTTISNKIHHINSFNSLENCKNIISSFVENHKDIIVLVDGPSDQRIQVLKIAQELMISHIVEHDAETFNSNELLQRVEISRKNRYNVYQYIKLNPETMFYTFDTIEDINYVKII